MVINLIFFILFAESVYVWAFGLKRYIFVSKVYRSYVKFLKEGSFKAIKTPLQKAIFDNLKEEKKLMSKSQLELLELDKNVSILAIIATITPFIGLFGTIVGVVGSIKALHLQSENFSEILIPLGNALYVTASALLVAVPALVFFNLINSLLDKIEILHIEIIRNLDE